MTPDLVIRGGLVFDGTGAAPSTADVAVHDGRITRIGEIDAEAPVELDARGLDVAPGFIDVHSHSDYTLLVDPRAVSAIHQGVTTEVIGNCGHGCLPHQGPVAFEPHHLRLRRHRAPGVVHAGGLPRTARAGGTRRQRHAPGAERPVASGHGGTRFPAGDGRRGGVHDPVAGGGHGGRRLGLLHGPRVRDRAGRPGAGDHGPGPGRGAAGRASTPPTPESREQHADEAVAEAIRTARNAGVRLQVSHLAPRSGLDQTNRCLDLVDAARAAGDDIAFDMHTRLYGLTFLYAMLPPWVVSESPEEQARLLRTPDARERIGAHKSIITGLGDWGRIYLLDNDVWPDMGRLDFEEIARSRGSTAPRRRLRSPAGQPGCGEGSHGAAAQLLGGPAGARVRPRAVRAGLRRHRARTRRTPGRLRLHGRLHLGLPGSGGSWSGRPAACRPRRQYTG